MNMRFALIVLASATLVAQSLVTTVAAGRDDQAAAAVLGGNPKTLLAARDPKTPAQLWMWHMGMLRGVRGGRRRHAGAPAEHRHGSSRRPAVRSSTTARASTTRCRVCACSTARVRTARCTRLSRWSAGISRGTKTSPGPSSFLGKEGNSESCRAQRAAHSALERPARRTEGRRCGWNQYEGQYRRRQDGSDVSDPGRPWCNRHRHAPRRATARARGTAPNASRCVRATPSRSSCRRVRGLQRAAQQDQSVLSRSHHRETGRRHDSRPSRS